MSHKYLTFAGSLTHTMSTTPDDHPKGKESRRQGDARCLVVCEWLISYIQSPLPQMNTPWITFDEFFESKTVFNDISIKTILPCNQRCEGSLPSIENRERKNGSSRLKSTRPPPLMPNESPVDSSSLPLCGRLREGYFSAALEPEISSENRSSTLLLVVTHNNG
ncbi:hypothetical protein PROFUN_07473 [Planoprotostelium fungivorum]|uniref:Uncharacterized protein n=1 Tax=Planoprotostelium fungivorum TaxID=1890364 RepID=A0A2P6NLL6_9EUKA|nr:hypothetical protein PROFUN_07473 [Planoprotostelium fungivorum]